MKQITEKEYDEAVKRAIDELATDPRLEGPSMFVIPLVGMLFASSARGILFGEKDG